MDCVVVVVVAAAAADKQTNKTDCKSSSKLLIFSLTLVRCVSCVEGVESGRPVSCSHFTHAAFVFFSLLFDCKPQHIRPKPYSTQGETGSALHLRLTNQLRP